MQEEEEIVLILSSISDLFIELEWINCPFSLFFPVVTNAISPCTHCLVFQ